MAGQHKRWGTLAIMSDDNLRRIIYLSAVVRALSENELRELMHVARKRNAAANVTGMLLHDRGSFAQVIEGPYNALGEIFDSIKRDPRHRNIICISDKTIHSRLFDGWSMGFLCTERDAMQAQDLLAFLDPIKDLPKTLAAVPASLEQSLLSNICHSMNGFHRKDI